MAVKSKKPQIRCLNEIKNLLYDKEWAKTAPNLKLYYVYRGVKRKNGLRYDITLIPPKMLGKEFVKTKGNRNSNSFPELYTVLSGKALLLLQKSENGKVKEAAAFNLEKGDWLIIPPDRIIVAINPGKKTLKTANWVSEKNENIYKEVEKMQGLCYYYTKDGWVKNKNYKTPPRLRFKRPLKKAPKDLSFLHGHC